MSMNRWLFRFSSLLVMIVWWMSLGSSQVFASVHVVTQPTDLTKVIEVELNDDYFNPNVITIPLAGSTTLLLKIKVKRAHLYSEKLGIDVVVQSGKKRILP